MKKPSELFEGKNSSLYKAYSNAVKKQSQLIKMIKLADSEIAEWTKFREDMKKRLDGKVCPECQFEDDKHSLECSHYKFKPFL